MKFLILKPRNFNIKFFPQIYDDEDDYYREDEQPMATSTERQQQEMTSSTTKRYSPSNTLDDLQKNIESNIGLTTLFNLDGDSPAMPKSSSAMPPSFGPQFPTADPMTVTNEEDEPEVFQSQKSRKSSPAKPSSPSGGPQDVFSSVPTPKMKGSKVKDLSKSKKKTKGKKKSKLNPVAELQLQGALAKLKRGRATLPPKVITPDMYAAPPEEKEAAEKVPFKRIRVMHSTTPRTTPKPGGQVFSLFNTLGICNICGLKAG